MTGLEKLIERALKDQPDPVESPESCGIVRSLIEDMECPDVIQEGLLDRGHRGYRTYGTFLMSHNGRDNLADAVQELLDAAQYIHAAKLTDGISPEEETALYQLLDYVEGLI